MTPERLASFLRRQGGAARTDVLFERGVTKYELAGLVASGALRRPIRGWIALPELPSEIELALRSGAVVSCATQAARLRLWVLAAPGVHLAARSRASRCVDPHARMHFGRGVLPRHPSALVDPIENVLANVAACLPYREAHAVWESALNKRLVRLDQLRRLPYRGAARRLLVECAPFSDSGLESMVKRDLRWLKVAIRPQAVVLGRRVDFLIGARLILQIDGATHTGEQRTSDIKFDAELVLAGYTVIRVAYEQVVHDWPGTQYLVVEAVGQGLHLAR